MLKLGWREWVSLPELGIGHVKAKVDSGARTSALHTFSLETYVEGDTKWARFGVHPLQRRQDEVWCTAPVVDVRTVRDSGGHEEERVVIETKLSIGELQKTIEVTLTDRDNMGFRMLLGRTAIRGDFLIDPGRSYLVGAKPPRRVRKPEQP